MIVYIEGKTLVKGVQLKDVYYIGTVEDDGYIYFNDKIAYRLPTPSNIQENVNINLSGVQVLYPSRNAWVRANYFTELKCIGVDPKGIYGDLNDHEHRLTELENWRMLEVDPTLDDHSTRITNLENRMTLLEARVTNIENVLGDVAGSLYNYSLSLNGTETTNTFSTLASWMKSMISHDLTLQQHRNTLYLRIDLINNTLDNHNSRITANTNAISALDTRLDTLEGTVANHTTAIDSLNREYNSLSQTVSQQGIAINGLRRDLNGIGDRTSALETAIGTWTGGATTMAMAITGLLDSMGTLPSWALDVGSALTSINDNTVNRTNLLRSWVNTLGHTSLGDGSSPTWSGNGEVLLDTINTLNSCINVINAQHSTSIPTLLVTVYNNWAERTFT